MGSRMIRAFDCSGDATPGRARSNDLAGRSTALAPALTPPCLLLCFISVIVWPENKYFTTSNRWPLYLFYFDRETISAALMACVLRATTKKRSSTFWGKKVHPGDLARGRSDLKMTWLLCCAGAATVWLVLTLMTLNDLERCSTFILRCFTEFDSLIWRPITSQWLKWLFNHVCKISFSTFGPNWPTQQSHGLCYSWATCS